MMHLPIKAATAMPLPALDRGGLWCILTVRGGNTVALARSLIEAGYPAWTPVAWNQHRRRRTDERFEVEISVTPTYVFVRVGADKEKAEAGVADLAHVAAARLSPHPDFAVFQYAGRVPLVSAQTLNLLRTEQVSAEAASQHRIATEILRLNQLAEDKQRVIALEALRKQVEAARKEAEEARAAAREALRLVRAKAPQLAAGDKVTADQDILKGMVGVVQGIKGHETLVLFGGSVPFAIETWLLHPVGVSRLKSI